MTKVLRIINRFNLGGISYNVSYLSRYMPAEFETMLIGGPEEEGEESSLFIARDLGLNPTVIEAMRRSVNPLQDYFAYRKIKKIIREFKPDIVHTHASKAGAVGRLAAVHCRVPVVVHTFHGHVFEGYFGSFKTAIFKSIERYLAKKSSAIVAISKIQKQELAEKHKICGPEKIHVIPLGFDLTKFTLDMDQKRKKFRAHFNINDDEIALGIIGRLAPIKNHTLFIDAVEEALSKNDANIKALIIGDGETRAGLEKYVSTKNARLQETIVFAGWIKEVDLALAGLDLVCLTSKNEGTPVSLIEAQAAGRFVVSTNVGGIQDILHADCGLLSPPNDKPAFVNNLLDAIKNFDRYKMKAGSAANEVSKKFSYSRLCDDMSKLYHHLLSSRK